MTPLQSRIIDLFREKFVCPCMLCQEKDHQFSTTAAFMESFLTTTLIPLIQEEERAKCRALIEGCKKKIE